MSVNEANLDRIREAYAHRRTHGDFMPAVYVVELTNICNLNCTICPRDGIPLAQRGHLDVEAAQKIAKTIAPYAELVMLYFMGEPLLHPQFAQIVRDFRNEVRGAIVISTNATKITDIAADALIECVDVPICCVDRHMAGDYEAIRRGAVYSEVVENVMELIRKGQRAGKRIVVKGLDLGMTIEERNAFLEFWEHKGAIPIVSWVNAWAGTLPHLLERAQIPMPYSGLPRVPCADLWFKLVVNYRAKIVQCCLDWNYSTAGGALEGPDTLQGIWHSEAMRAKRKLHGEGKYGEASDMCGRCREWAALEDLDAYLGRTLDELSLVF